MTYSFSSVSFTRAVLVVVAGLAFAAIANDAAASTPEQACQKGRLDAGARYVECQQRLLGKVLGSGSALGIDAAAAKCRGKYFSTWSKIQSKAAGSGTTCDSARFVDNGDGTVTDHLTNLQWEKKTNAGVQDVGQIYRLNQSGVIPTPNGTAYTTLIATLNGGCFAGPCDWRIPTFAELQTIQEQPCVDPACMDATFGLNDTQYWWTSTPNLTSPNSGWVVRFLDGTLNQFSRANDFRVRAVRGGL